MKYLTSKSFFLSLVIFLGLVVPLTLWTSRSNAMGFDLVKEGDQICRYNSLDQGAKEKEFCIPLMSPRDADINITKQIEFIRQNPQIKDTEGSSDMSILKQAGGSILLSDSQKQYVENNFSELHLINVGVALDNPSFDTAPSGLQILEGKISFPFLATVLWKNKNWIQFGGQYYISGTIELTLGDIFQFLTHRGPSDFKPESHLRDLSDVCTLGTDSGGYCIRFIERWSRGLHLKVSTPLQGTHPQSTQDQAEIFVREIVGPVLLGEYYVKIQKAFDDILKMHSNEFF